MVARLPRRYGNSPAWPRNHAVPARAIRPGPEILDRIRLLITVNLALGTATIVVASLGHVW